MKVVRDKGWSGMGTSELNEAEGPAKGIEEGIPGRGNSQCKGPEAGAVIRLVWLELSEGGGEEREWGEVRAVVQDDWLFLQVGWDPWRAENRRDVP